MLKSKTIADIEQETKGMSAEERADYIHTSCREYLQQHDEDLKDAAEMLKGNEYFVQLARLFMRFDDLTCDLSDLANCFTKISNDGETLDKEILLLLVQQSTKNLEHLVDEAFGIIADGSESCITDVAQAVLNGQ